MIIIHVLATQARDGATDTSLSPPGDELTPPEVGDAATNTPDNHQMSSRAQTQTCVRPCYR